ncbi:MAG: hypothetical protein FJW39_00395 [Acidobacteria bacterium]|nr:hypothetical protein [Acidobacteriota bacterium]
MKLRLCLGGALLSAGLLGEDTGVRLVLGYGDALQTAWDGSVSAKGARIKEVGPWRFEAPDAIDGTSWKAQIHQIRLFGAANRGVAPPPVANGVIVQLTDAGRDAVLDVRTAQGAFSVSLAQIPYGKMVHFLNGRASADRVPAASAVTTSPEEQDYPAAAVGANGDVWAAWMEFKHHPEHNRLRSPLKSAPAKFDEFTTKPPGDQIFAARYSNGQWQQPVAVTPPGGDLYRPAIAVDGQGRAWVFWSANQGGNFDLYGRAMDGNGAAVRLSSAPGSDVFPAAATDSSGRVWVAWQGWRNGKAAIFAATQNGNGFGAAQTVSSAAGNEWNPAIAADSKGRVTVAYESYRNGNYDIFLRTATNGSWAAEQPGAVTARYEAYPSIAYEPGGRLWLAHEEGSARWGKDFGADESSGVALYQGRAIRVRGWDPDGRAVEPVADLGAALPGAAAQRTDSNGRQSDAAEYFSARPEAWKNRDPARPTANFIAPRNTSPRLTVDASGRLWLAARSPHPISWSPIGTVWSEYVVSYDGSQWTGPVFLSHSDNLLDNRPALISPARGDLMVLSSTDHRRQPLGARFRARALTAIDDPYQNDVVTNVLRLGPGSGKLEVKTAAGPGASGTDPLDRQEETLVAAMRKARVGGNLHVVRGEFHRHSEVSGDGGNDGTLLEQWRYALDAANMDWVGCCDHDNGGGREYTWWITQKLTDVFYTPGKFVPMFSYERSVPYPEGHRNVVFAQRGIRTLPRLPRTEEAPVQKAPDTLMLYRYLKQFNGIAAMHTSGTNMGTDWRDNDPLVEPVVEIYQGDRQNYEMPGAPRTNSENDSIGGWRPKGFVNLALEMGYKLSFQASSDHISTHMSYCNVLASSLTREAVLEGFQKRHVYGATDNILADFRSGNHIMGDAFSSARPPEFRVKLTGSAPFAKVWMVKDNQYVYTAEPGSVNVDFTWRDASPVAGKQSYYYVRGLQQDGEVVWVSPMWITYTGK